MEEDIMEAIMPDRLLGAIDPSFAGPSGGQGLLVEDDILKSSRRGGFGLGPFGDDGLAPRGNRHRDYDDGHFGRSRGGRAGGFDEDIFGFNEDPYDRRGADYEPRMDDFMLFDDFGPRHREPFRSLAYEDDMMAEMDIGHSRRRELLPMDRGMERHPQDISNIWDADYMDEDDEDPDMPWNVMDSIEYRPDAMAVFRSAAHDPPRRCLLGQLTHRDGHVLEGRQVIEWEILEQTCYSVPRRLLVEARLVDPKHQSRPHLSTKDIFPLNALMVLPPDDPRRASRRDGLEPRGSRRRALDDELLGRPRRARRPRAGGFDEDLFGQRYNRQADTRRDFMTGGDFTLFGDFDLPHRGRDMGALDDDILAGMDIDHSMSMDRQAMNRGMDMFASGQRGTLEDDISRAWGDNPFARVERDRSFNIMDSVFYDTARAVNTARDPMAAFPPK
ncbi:hypothetical protein Q7P37_002329 [Cladosporium fusiforme]